MKNQEKEVYGVIYKITCLVNNKCYIGKTIQCIEKYIENHFKNAINNIDNNKKCLYRAIRKYKKDNFKWEILGTCDSEIKLNKSEIECIYFFRSFGSDGENCDYIYGYNMTEGGDGGNPWSGISEKERKKRIEKIRKALTGRKLSEEHCRNAGRARKGKTIHNDKFKEDLSNRMKGIPFTEDHKQKISEANKGKNFSEEHCRNLSISHKGIKLSEEHCKSISKATKGEGNPFYGKKHTKETRKKMSESKKGKCIGKNSPVYKDINIIEILDLRYNKKLSLRKIAEKFNVSSGTIQNRLKNLEKYL